MTLKTSRKLRYRRQTKKFNVPREVVAYLKEGGVRGGGVTDHHMKFANIY